MLRVFFKQYRLIRVLVRYMLGFEDFAVCHFKSGSSLFGYTSIRPDNHLYFLPGLKEEGERFSLRASLLHSWCMGSCPTSPLNKWFI